MLPDINLKVPFVSGYQYLYKNMELYAHNYGQYKICIPEAGKDMALFDLKADPSKSNNLAKEKPELFTILKSKLKEVKISWKDSRERRDYQWEHTPLYISS
jgi:hypothetical protein